MSQPTIRRRVLLALIAVAASFAVLMIFAARYYGELLDAERLNQHTYRVLGALAEVQADLASVRGLGYCALTGSASFTAGAPRADAYEGHYREVLELTRDDPRQQRLLSEVDTLWSMWRGGFVVPLLAMCKLPPDAQRPSVAEIERIGAAGNRYYHEISAHLDDMVAEERALLGERQETLTRLRAVTAGTLTFAGVLAVLLALFTFTSLVRAAGLQDRLNRTLEEEVQQRRVAEKRLTDSELRVRTVLENVPDGIITIDERGTIESFNPSAEAIFGYLAEDMIGRNISVIMPDPYRLAHNSYLERHALTGESRIIGRRRELVGQRADGSRFEVDLAVTEIWIDGEKLYTGIIRDISEAKRRTAEIQRFKATLDNTLDMIFMFDPVTLEYVYVNRGAREALGYTAEELQKQHVCDSTPAMPEHVFRSHIAQLISGMRPWLSYETLQRRRDGSEFPVEVFLQLVQDDPNDPGLFIGIARDLTERRRIDRMKSEFISIISHELRTPLTSIRGSLGLLRGGAAGVLPERTRRMIEIADHNSERLVRLINDMLDMEKIESGKMRFDMRPLGVAHLLDYALEANRGYASQYEVRFVAQTPDREAQVYGDFDRLLQVMNNLLSNAAKFSKKRGQVEVGFTRQGPFVRIYVTDHGSGIPEEFKHRIFERFSQADTSDARRKGGTGLGLSICKAILERHDGILGYKSEAGQGAMFWFELPLWDSPAPAHGETDSGAPRILVCDDDVDVADLLVMMLRDAGYQTDTAYSAEQAKRALAERDYALLTLDIKLPGQDGVSLIRELSEKRSAGRLPPVVVVTGHDSVQGDEFVGSHAVLDWLAKPIDRERLLAAARRAVRGRGTRVHVLHVEDDADVRYVLQTLVGEEVEVTAAGSLSEATALLTARAFDLVVLDVGLPDASGLELLPVMAGLNARTPVLVFSAHDTSPELSNRVAAALVKSRTSNQELLDMVRRLVA